MSVQAKFQETMEAGYTCQGTSFVIGAAMQEGKPVSGLQIKVPLKPLNRHGLIAGATGTGKTKTLQLFAEQLSKNGVSCLLMDIKGDLSGIAKAGTTNTKIEERHALIGTPWRAQGNPVELMSLTGENGLRLRATVSEFGPVLFSKILGLNDTQSSVMSVVYKYCDDHQLPLLDLDDIKKVLQFAAGDGKASFEAEYGLVSGTTVGAIQRKIVELEQQGAEVFFGEPSFDVDDLVRMDENGFGMISILRVTDLQDKPKLFSTFMLQLLAEVYATMPEEGDLEQPKLCIFIDEAHLVFSEASKALMEQIEAIIRMIRSKGVGVFFITQNPADIPESVLGQLGLKIQHALRAFTAKDRQSIKLAAQNFPESDFYNVEDLLTQLGIGEAFVTVLNEKGIPTPLVHTLLCAPASRMDVLTNDEIQAVISSSPLAKKYAQDINRESAYELLNAKMEEAASEAHQAKMQEEQVKASKTKTSTSQEKSTFEKVMNAPVTKQVGRTVMREITRGLLGVLGLGGSSKTRKKSGWF